MMWIIGLLTVVLVLDCLLLILLVLVQLPKKEAGMGQAFGGAATDALFGAGSGNALTKLTKYATVAFLLLTMCLSILNAQATKSTKTKFQREVEAAKPTAPPPMPAAPVTARPVTTGSVINPSAMPTNAGGLAPVRTNDDSGLPPVRTNDAAAPRTNAPPQ